MAERNILSNSLRILGLTDSVTIDEIRQKYIDKTTVTKFQSIFLLNENLRSEFVKYHEAYVIALKEISSLTSGENPGFYPGGLVFNLILNQGIYFLIKENLLKAGEKLEEAARIKSDYTLAQVYLGIVLMKRKRYYSAERYFLKSSIAEPENEYVWLYLSMNYEKAGELKKAQQTLDRVRALAPIDPDVIAEIKKINQLIIDDMNREKKGSFIKKIFEK